MQYFAQWAAAAVMILGGFLASTCFPFITLTFYLTTTRGTSTTYAANTNTNANTNADTDANTNDNTNTNGLIFYTPLCVTMLYLQSKAKHLEVRITNGIDLHWLISINNTLSGNDTRK